TRSGADLFDRLDYSRDRRRYRLGGPRPILPQRDNDAARGGFDQVVSAPRHDERQHDRSAANTGVGTTPISARPVKNITGRWNRYSEKLTLPAKRSGLLASRRAVSGCSQAHRNTTSAAQNPVDRFQKLPRVSNTMR